jgi:hypothetical protein
LSTAITRDEFFEVARDNCTPSQLDALERIIDFIDKSTELSLSYTKAKTHHTVTASYVRRDNGRTKVFSCYEDGRAMCQYRLSLPDHLTDAQQSAIQDAYEAYRKATAGDKGSSWGWFRVNSTSFSVLAKAIQELSTVLHEQFDGSAGTGS